MEPHSESHESQPSPSFSRKDTDVLLPPISLGPSTRISPSSPLQETLRLLKLPSVPPHPVQPVLQCGGNIKVDIKHLYLDDKQMASISAIYATKSQFHHLFDLSPASQQQASEILGKQGVDVGNLEDLSSRWSVRWSKMNVKTEKDKRCLLQCLCGSDSQARKVKEDAIKLKKGQTVYPHEWRRKMPYNFTGCLAHIDITFNRQSLSIIRITGILNHDLNCESQEMQRLPPVPLHPHVWRCAIEHLNKGASIAFIQEDNRRLYHQASYDDQTLQQADKANIRYLFLPGDTSRLYRMQARTQGVDLSKPPECNVEEWLDPQSPYYKPELAAAIFYYRARANTSERFKVCIHNEEMKAAAWKYAHNGQLILDGTFGICDRRLLLFIGMAVDDMNKGVPIVFLLFSAPAGSQATHAGYDTEILTELLGEWHKSLGKGVEGTNFAPKVAITDTDTKERGALITIWPALFLLLCKFHVRNAWANRRKMLIKMGTVMVFAKQQVVSRLRSLDQSLILTTDFKTAQDLVEGERRYLTMMLTDTDTSCTAQSGLEYLEYLGNNWLSLELWRSWSQAGRNEAARILNVSIEKVAPTTNHLEAFNGVLKRNHISRFQKGGRRLRFDLLIFLLVTRILPAIFQQRSVTAAFYDWLGQRFSEAAGGKILMRSSQLPPRDKKTLSASEQDHQYGWWSEESHLASEEEATLILQKKHIGDFKWLDSFTMAATCASSKEDIRVIGHTRLVPTLINDPQRASPPSNVSADIVSDAEEVIEQLVKERGVLDEELVDDEEEEFEGAKLSEQNQSAIQCQLQGRLAHELQQTLPRLFRIHALLQQLGSSKGPSSHLQELREVSTLILKNLDALPPSNELMAAVTVAPSSQGAELAYSHLEDLPRCVVRVPVSGVAHGVDAETAAHPVVAGFRSEPLDANRFCGDHSITQARKGCARDRHARLMGIETSQAPWGLTTRIDFPPLLSTHNHLTGPLPPQATCTAPDARCGEKASQFAGARRFEGDISPEDLFNMFFGGRMGGGRVGPFGNGFRGGGFGSGPAVFTASFGPGGFRTTHMGGMGGARARPAQEQPQTTRSMFTRPYLPFFSVRYPIY
ncbi:hypothetical protein M422DRAFT_248771 [Sphaerobolus stellatus SS14]|nr:hypothetical protein M422DRAFT_248771 [Sphaerobolus stellatus SS14]